MTFRNPSRTWVHGRFDQVIRRSRQEQIRAKLGEISVNARMLDSRT
jgi:hypothetical protein